MRRGILLSTRRSATCISDSAASPDQARVEPPAALMGFSMPFAGLLPRTGWNARFGAVRTRVPLANLSSLAVFASSIVQRYVLVMV